MEEMLQLPDEETRSVRKRDQSRAKVLIPHIGKDEMETKG